MSSKTEKDLIAILKNFTRSLDEHPTYGEMYEEVRMMNFKIRPLKGDVALLDLKNKRLIEVLWRLGRLDEFFSREIKKVPADRKEMFHTYFDDMHRKLQDQLNHLNLRAEKVESSAPFFEMEIVKELPHTKKIN